LWVFDELQYDKFHKDSDRIFQVFENQTYSTGEILSYDATPAPLAEKLRSEFAEVELSTHYSWPRQMLFSNGEKSIYNEGFFADTSFFRLFTFRLLEGNSAKLLRDPNSVVITKKMAERYFPAQSALGKTLRADNDWDLTISGVVEDIPQNSSIWFDFVVPFELYSQRTSKPLDWSNHSLFTFVKLKSGVNPESLSNKIQDVLISTHAESSKIQLFLFPLSGVRLYWDFENGKPTGGGRIDYVIGLSLFAFLILIAACVNLVNLTTAKAAVRAKEVGIRKVGGSSRMDLIKQFLTESMLLAFLSLLVALFLASICLPLFNYLVGKNLQLDFLDYRFIGGLLVITIFTGFLSGSYPAFLLSSYKPVTVLKRNLHSPNEKVGIRNLLVFFQFGFSIVLIIVAVVYNSQLQYILNKDLGFDKENLIYFQPLPGSLKNIESFKNELLKNPSIQSVGQGYDNPLNINNNDIALWDGIPSDQPVTVQTTICDQDYIKSLGLKILKGRLFSDNVSADSTNFIINETCAFQMGLENPIGHRLKVYNTEGRVIGVVSDFHHRDLKSSIAPLIFVAGKASVKPMTVFIRNTPGEFKKAIAAVESVYKKFEPNFPLQLSFFEREIKNVMFDSLALGQLAIWLTAIVTFISAIGLLGLVLFTIERRTKEIGIRKILGATIKQIAILLSKEFFKPIAVSIIVALPIGYYITVEWLSGFAFHVTFSLWWLALAVFLLLLLTCITVGFHVIKAGNMNPTENLRSE